MKVSRPAMGKMVHYDAICTDILEHYLKECLGSCIFRDLKKKNRCLIKTVLVLKLILLFKSWHPNLVCSKRDIRRNKPQHPGIPLKMARHLAYRLKWPGIWHTKDGL